MASMGHKLSIRVYSPTRVIVELDGVIVRHITGVEFRMREGELPEAVITFIPAEVEIDAPADA